MNVIAGNSLLIIEVSLAVAAGGLILLIASLTSRYWKRYTAQMEIDRQFEDQLSSELSTGVKRTNKLWLKWNRFWSKRLVDSGVNVAHVTKENAGKAAIIIDLGILGLLSILFKGSVIGAIIVVIASNVIASIILELLATKRMDKLENQVPAFLSALRAANDTSSSTRISLLQAIGTTSHELHAEMQGVEEQLQAGGQIQTVLQEFEQKTPIDAMRMLMSCIRIVDASGKDMSEQIKIIQEVMDTSMQLKKKRQKAVASTMPTMYVATAFIPGMFLYTWFFQSIAKTFWFHSLMSWVLLIVVIALYLVGVWIAKHLVDNIRNM